MINKPSGFTAFLTLSGLSCLSVAESKVDFSKDKIDLENAANVNLYLVLIALLLSMNFPGFSFAKSTEHNFEKVLHFEECSKGSHDAVVDIELNSKEVDGLKNIADMNSNKPLTMFIHESIHNHRLGAYFKQVIHKANEIWSNSVGQEVFVIHDFFDESIVEKQSTPLMSYLYRTAGNSLVRHFRKYVMQPKSEAAEDFVYEPEHEEPRFDGVSMIYYGFDPRTGPWFPRGFTGAAFPAYDLNWRSLIFNSKLSKRIIESDILMNGRYIEDNTNWLCGSLASYLRPEYLKNYMADLKAYNDKCTMIKFMVVMLHEMGHALMLKHSDLSKSVMNEELTNIIPLVTAYDTGKLNQVDIDAFHDVNR